MTITKADIVESIYSQCGFSKTKSDKLLETILDGFVKSRHSGENRSPGVLYVYE